MKVQMFSKSSYHEVRPSNGLLLLNSVRAIINTSFLVIIIITNYLNRLLALITTIVRNCQMKKVFDLGKTLMLCIRCLQFAVGRASVMAIFIGRKTNSGQVSVCGDAYGGSTALLRQHLALLYSRVRSDRSKRCGRLLLHRG